MGIKVTVPSVPWKVTVTILGEIAQTEVGRAPAPLAVAGAFFGFYYFELGASGHFPLGRDRPEWLPGLSFGIRVNVPLSTYAKQRTYSP